MDSLDLKSAESLLIPKWSRGWSVTGDSHLIIELAKSGSGIVRPFAEKLVISTEVVVKQLVELLSMGLEQMMCPR
jgi:hypothetical protein